MWRGSYPVHVADAVDFLCKLARSLPDVEEQVACAGTAIEQASFHTGGKSFLFAQRKGDLAIVRLKLDRSLADAAAAGDGVEVGIGNWTTCRVPLAKAPTAVLVRWVRESHALSAKPGAPAKPKPKGPAKPKGAAGPKSARKAARKKP